MPEMLHPNADLSAVRNGPKVDLVATQLNLLVRRPVPHIVAVRDDAGTRLQLLQKLGPQLKIDPRQLVKGHDRGFAEISVERVLFVQLGKALTDR
jgi:hypothetical protein